MRVAVTGASGLVGGAVVSRLLDRGHEVLALSRRPVPARPGLEHRRWDLTGGVLPDPPPVDVVVPDPLRTTRGEWFVAVPSAEVGRDLLVTGWDDIMAARYAELTTVRQPLHDLGATAARFLDDLIGGRRAEPRHEVLPTELIVRSSSSPAKGEDQ